MCLAIPSKVISTKNEKIIIDQTGQEISVAGSLIDVEVGDYVILQNNFIVRKLDAESAREILNLLKKEG